MIFCDKKLFASWLLKSKIEEISGRGSSEREEGRISEWRVRGDLGPDYLDANAQSMIEKSKTGGTSPELSLS